MHAMNEFVLEISKKIILLHLSQSQRNLMYVDSEPVNKIYNMYFRGIFLHKSDCYVNVIYIYMSLLVFSLFLSFRLISATKHVSELRELKRKLE